MSDEPLIVCLIQNYLAPYRIPLFQRIAAAKKVDFTLLLMAREHTSYPQWANLWRNLPFKCRLIPGWRFHLNSNTESCFNPALLVALIRLRPDVVICSGFSSNTILALVYRLMFDKRILVWTEATATSESYLSYPRTRERMRRILARGIDGFIDAGSQARAYAQSLLAQNRHVPFFRSYNAIDNDEFAHRCDNFRKDIAVFETFRGRFAPQNILFSGQLIERKNIRRMLDAYEAILQRSAMPIGLIVLGQGPLHDELVERKRKRNLTHLHIEGFQVADTYHKYFAAADVFMLLSVFDCNPLVIFEALAAGLPIICSKNAGNAVDFIENGKNGYIVDPKMSADVAAKSLTILNAHDRQPMMAAAARKAVQKANYEESASGFDSAIKRIVRL